MKKVLFLAISVLGSALFLTSCGGGDKPGQTDSEVTGITVAPASYTFTLGDDPLRLSYTLAPAGVNATVEWTSSNEDVATVDNAGRVTALNIGEATITAKVKDTDIQGACKITVNSLESNLKFTEAYVGIVDYDSINTIRLDVGGDFGELNVHVANGRIQLFTEGLYFNASGQLDGAKRGGWIYMNAPIALAYADDNKDNSAMQQYQNGVSFSLGRYRIDLDREDTLETKWNHAHKGYADNEVFIGYLKKWVDSYNKEGTFTQENYQDFAYAGIDGFGGATLSLKEYAVNDDGEGEYGGYPNWLWRYTPNGIVTGGSVYIGGTTGSSQYMHKIDSLDVTIKFVTTDTIGIPGAYFAFENNQYVLKSTGVEFGAEQTYQLNPPVAKSPANVEFFVDYILPRVSENPYDGKTIELPSNKLTIK